MALLLGVRSGGRLAVAQPDDDCTSALAVGVVPTSCSSAPAVSGSLRFDNARPVATATLALRVRVRLCWLSRHFIFYFWSMQSGATQPWKLKIEWSLALSWLLTHTRFINAKLLCHSVTCSALTNSILSCLAHGAHRDKASSTWVLLSGTKACFTHWDCCTRKIRRLVLWLQHTRRYEVQEYVRLCGLK